MLLNAVSAKVKTSIEFHSALVTRIALFIMIAVLSTGTALAVTTHYIAANGSDSNNGTSTSTPWLHAPGMPSCTGSCASYTPQPGDQFIFRGGDTWHFGNSSASPYTGSAPSCGPNAGTCGWVLQWNGSSSSPIYWGVNTSYYSGSSWSRPIMNGDNPTSTRAVSTCSFDQSKFNFLKTSNTSYNTIDNFEFTGLCWHGNQSNSNEMICCAGFVGGGMDVNNIYSNLYIHGWTHEPFTCSISGGEPTGTCDGTYGLEVTATGGQITGYVCDGSDADGVSLGCILWDCANVSNSVLRYASQGAVCNNAHSWHDNLIEHIAQSGDGVSHGNGVEFNVEASGSNYFYNNVIRDNFASSSGVTTWFCPNSTDYYFNNVYYNNPGGQIAFAAVCGSSASYFYSNTYADSSTLGMGGSWVGRLYNNLIINTSLLGTPAANANNVTMSDAQATAAGFTSGGTYAYQPESQNCNGEASCPVGAGTNLTSTWPSGMPTTDADYGCTYDTSNHSVSCPGRAPVARPASGSWDVGAFEFAVGTAAPNPPTGLSAIVN